MPVSQRVTANMYSLTSPDPQRIARFWSELLDLPIAAGASDEFVMLDVDHVAGDTTWLIQRGEPTRGVAPITFDIGIDDDERWAEAADRAESLGAERVVQHEHDGVRWIEMRDPDGTGFRVFAPRPQ